MPRSRVRATACLDLLDFDAAIHRVENALRATFGAYPDSETTELGEEIEHLFVERSAREMHSNGMRR